MIAAATKPWIVSNMGLVADFFGVQPSTVRGDWRQAGMPGRKGQWNLKAILEWRDSRPSSQVAPRAASNGHPQSPSSRKQLAESLFAERKAERLQIEMQRLRGEVINRDDARRELAEILVIVKSRLESIPQDCMLETPKRQRPKIQRTVSRKIDLALRQLATTQVAGGSCDDAILETADAIRSRRQAAEGAAA
jgi:phage terminase Nu1 subunit (DNA packaging protein)